MRRALIVGAVALASGAEAKPVSLIVIDSFASIKEGETRCVDARRWHDEEKNKLKNGLATARNTIRPANT